MEGGCDGCCWSCFLAALYFKLVGGVVVVVVVKASALMTFLSCSM